MGTKWVPKWVPKLRTRAVIIVIELSLPILPQKYIRGILVEGRCLLDSTGDYVRGAGVTGIQTLTTEDVETLRPGGMKIQCFFFSTVGCLAVGRVLKLVLKFLIFQSLNNIVSICSSRLSNETSSPELNILLLVLFYRRM